MDITAYAAAVAKAKAISGGGGGGGITFEIVEELPETGDSGVIYLVANSGTSPNAYNEYIYINSAYEMLGTTPLDPVAAVSAHNSSSSAHSDIRETVSGKYSKPSGGIPDSDLSSAVQTSLGKADTAYQKPSGGIPDTDFTSAVQSALTAAGTALQTVKVNGTALTPDANKAVNILIGDGSDIFTYNNAGLHNSIYRGKSLGSSVTAEQWAMIGAGTFDDLYIGDYWTINDINWRIAAFDYWLHTGDTECITHHIVIVPDAILATDVPMNSTNTASGADVGSDFYTGNHSNTGKSQSVTKVNSAFGSAHILSYRE